MRPAFPSPIHRRAERARLASFLLFFGWTYKETFNMSYRTKLTYLFIPAIVAFAVPAFSQEADQCASDADCEEGYGCEKAYYSNPCDPDAGSCDSKSYEEEFGSCVKMPVLCESDSDCGEYLSCESSDSGGCWASSDGTSGCSEPDPGAPQYCAPQFVECETDVDCPRSFECISGVSCVEIDCADGEECDLPACEPIGGECVPEQIDCEVDADCPSDWSCFLATEYSCSGGGSSDGDGAGGVSVGGTSGGTDGDDPGEPTADRDPDAFPRDLPEETCVEVRTTGTCQPDAWEGSYYGRDAVAGTDGGGESLVGKGPTGDDTTEEGDSDGEASDAGGCSVSHRGTSSPAPSGLLFLLLAPFALLRRRRETGR